MTTRILLTYLTRVLVTFFFAENIFFHSADFVVSF